MIHPHDMSEPVTEDSVRELWEGAEYLQNPFFDYVLIVRTLPCNQR
jgi:hypothetical protein